jgi:signal peptide peptidase SppA
MLRAEAIEERPALTRGPLSLALPAVDLFWLVETRWAQQALSLLQGIDWRAHAREYAELQARLRGEAQEPPRKPYRVTESGTAVLGLTGPMTKREQSWGEGTSTVSLRRRLRQATSDPDVKSIALLIDSPGGQVSGAFDLAKDVARAREKKRTVAYIEDLGASAAYAVASQASAVYANENALVGSIGTYAVIEDLSRLAANLGVQVHVIRAGAFKGAGQPGTPVSESQLAEWQREVESVNEVFLNTVARGRGLDLEQVRTLADGRIHVAGDAEALGLIDGIQSFDQVLADLEQASGTPAGTVRAASGGGEEGAAMSRMESFLAWLKGEGGDEQPPGAEGAPAVGTAVLIPGEPLKPVVTMGQDEHARLTAQAAAGTQALEALRAQLLKDTVRADGKPDPLISAVADECVRTGNLERLSELTAAAAEKVKSTFKPGTSADRAAATQRPDDDEEPEGFAAVLERTARDKAKRLTARNVLHGGDAIRGNGGRN